MRIVNETFKKVLVLSAHADDAEFFAGGTLIKLARSGAEITEVIATDNGRGSFEMATTELVAQSRETEARAAAKVVGKHAVHFLGYPDGFLDDTPKNELRRIFMEWIRRVRPDCVMSFDPFNPFETHPDHIHVSRAAVEAVGFASLPLYHPEQVAAGLAPHRVKTCYWFAKHPKERSNVAVDISDAMDAKVEALCAHTSQMRMTVKDIRDSLELIEQHLELLPLLDVDNYAPVIAFYMQRWAADQGASAGLASAELFRREMAGDLFSEE